MITFDSEPTDIDLIEEAILAEFGYDADEEISEEDEVLLYA